MHIDTLLAEIKSDFSKYDAQGLIDDDSCYRWAYNALRKFGNNIREIQEDIVYVKNGQAKLPDNFFSLYDALRAEAGYYCVNSSKEEDPAILDVLMWKETTTRKQTWDSCATCCKEESEETIKERIFIDMNSNEYIDLFYRNPRRLFLGKNITKDSIAPKCRLQYAPYTSEDVITIQEKTLYTNFDEGVVFIQYYGLPQDEAGKPIIPETDMNYVQEFVEYHLKRKILENIIANSDDTNLANLFQNITIREESLRALARTDAAFSKLTPNFFTRMRNLARIDSMKYEIGFPKI